MPRFLIITLLLIALANNVYSLGKKIVLEQPLTIPAKEITAIMLELTYPPGGMGLPPHKHPGPVVGYVVEGQVLLQFEGGPPELLSAGQAFYEKDGAVHIWGANASNSTASKVLATIMARPGEPTVTMVDNFKRDDFNTALKVAKKRV